MAVLAPERPSLFDSPHGERHDDDGGEGAGLTLDAMLSGAWEGLDARAAVACPACGGAMRPWPGTTPGGSCGDCGASLS